MAGEDIERLTPEFALVDALRDVPALMSADGSVKVAAMQPKKGWKPPFVFYIPQEDSEEMALDGQTGLQHFAAQLHFVGGTHRGLQHLCQRAKAALNTMPGSVYITPRETSYYGYTHDEDWPRGSVLIESVDLQQTSPDLFENEVSYYRRMYTVRIDYQTQEVFEDDD